MDGGGGGERQNCLALTGSSGLFRPGSVLTDSMCKRYLHLMVCSVQDGERASALCLVAGK